MLRRTILFLICSTLLTGCASSTSVYVLNKEEVLRVKTGQSLNSAFDGWFFSDRAVDRVMNAKIKGINLK